MSALRSLTLSLDFGDTGGIPIWSMLADVPTLQTLGKLQLSRCGMNMHDYTTFVLKHVDTLKLLEIIWLRLYDGTVSDLRKFYAELSMAPRLEAFHQYALYWRDYRRYKWVRLPLHLCSAQDRQGENEDGYVEIELWCWSIRMDSRREARSVLAELAVCLS